MLRSHLDEADVTLLLYKAAACWRISAPKFRNLVAEWSDARLLSHLTCTLDAARYPSRIVPRLCTSTAGSCSGHDVQSCGDIALHSHSIFIHSFIHLPDGSDMRRVRGDDDTTTTTMTTRTPFHLLGFQISHAGLRQLITLVLRCSMAAVGARGE